MGIFLTAASYQYYISLLSIADMVAIYQAMGACLLTLASTVDFISITLLVEEVYASGLPGHIPIEAVYALVTGSYMGSVPVMSITPNDLENILSTGSHIIASCGNNGIDAP